MPFTFEKTALDGVIIAEPRVFNDSRGYFFEGYKQSEFIENGISDTFVQDNISFSSKGVLRGLHYQTEPYAQGKLVRCSKGAVWDVAVDIRKNSNTFGRWVGVELSEENKKMIFVPKGFAHGFYTLRDNSEVQYKVSAEYNPHSEAGIMWNDETLNIAWPEGEKLLSEKDLLLKKLNEALLF